MAGFPSLWWLNNIPLCVCVCVCVCRIFFIHSSVDGHLGWFHILPIVNNAAVKMGVQVSLQDLISFPLDIYPEVGLLYHKLVLFLIFWGTSILFSIVAAPFTFLPTVSRVPFSPHPWESKKLKLIEAENRMVVDRGLGWGKLGDVG